MDEEKKIHKGPQEGHERQGKGGIWKGDAMQALRGATKIKSRGAST